MNYTERKESETLIELGISQDTADLIYIDDLEFPSVIPGISYSEVKKRLGETRKSLPSWTTDALLNILPDRIKETTGEYQLLIFPDRNTSMWVAMYDKIETHDHILEATGDKEYRKAVYKMIVWFLRKEKERMETESNPS